MHSLLRKPATYLRLAIGIAALACGGGSGAGNFTGTTNGSTPTLTAISVSLASAAVQVGQTTTATANGTDQNGAPIAIGTVTWASSNTAVATIDASGSGRITAVGAGTTQISASAGGKTGQATLTVAAAPSVANVTVHLSAPTVSPGQPDTATAVAVDQNGVAFTNGTVQWSSSDTSVARVSTTGIITALAAGTAQITASVGGKQGSATLTVTAVPVATVTISPTTVSLIVGGTQQMTATVRDANGNVLTNRAISWSSSDPTKATVGTTTGFVQAIAPGTATIVATSENKSASATVTVSSTTPAASCTTSSAAQLSIGEVRQLTAAQVASLCVGGLGSASEYVLIPFNNSNVASSTTQIELSSTNTAAVTASLSRSPLGGSRLSVSRAALLGRQAEGTFRTLERSQIGALPARARVTSASPRLGMRGFLTGVAATPAVGSMVQLNSNLNGNTCTDPKVLHTARVVAVLQHSIIFIDTLAPAGGYTDAELTTFGQEFDQYGFALDTTNFGAPTDIDGNGRVGIFFTPGINQIPGPVGGVIGGLFAARDLFPATAAGCPASNEGEMFYLPVPDPNKTINGGYADKSFVSQLAVPTLVHEFQHLINAGRRLYVNNAPSLEEVWLNEGLSHIAEELLYYHDSGNAPGENIDLTRVKSSQTGVTAFNNDESQNFGRLSSYLAAPYANSPFSLVDGLAMRGAIWDFLRYSADQKSTANQSTIWRALVNTTLTGQANYNAVFGDIITNARNWAVTQFTDDAGFAVPAQYTEPSWNFRSVFSGTSAGQLPLVTQQLVSGTPVTITIDGGGAAYVRFRINAGLAATVAGTSTGQAVPPNIDFILVRTQ